VIKFYIYLYLLSPRPLATLHPTMLTNSCMLDVDTHITGLQLHTDRLRFVNATQFFSFLKVHRIVQESKFWKPWKSLAAMKFATGTIIFASENWNIASRYRITSGLCAYSILLKYMGEYIQLLKSTFCSFFIATI
jgi:hypothetical protein